MRVFTPSSVPIGRASGRGCVHTQAPGVAAPGSGRIALYTEAIRHTRPGAAMTHASRPHPEDPSGTSPATLDATELARAGDIIDQITSHVRLRIIGQDDLTQALLITLMARGHILIESVPGLAKTTAAKTLASAVNASFARIQCTPDLMPSDIVGTQIFSMSSGHMTTQLGPVHANFVLLDEINRSSAKTQSAMLQAMEERQVSIGGTDYPLPAPFMVMATQNPIEEEGTYVLPEAQMDRFLLKTVLPYPTPSDEIAVVAAHAAGSFDADLPEGTVTTEDIATLQGYCARVYVHPSIQTYIVDLINTTRGGGPSPIPGLMANLRMGASPRGSLALMRAAQAHALLAQRSYVIPDDVTATRHAVLRHRIVRTYDAIAQGISPESIIDSVFQVVPVP
ncbi:MoxR family ATPase [Winkia sp. C62]|uniref:MoxR family ATPase n=2 Tax=Nanchangia anserum TaxID=2692125 RepID=A0A8I0GGC9_9ACTO|nr:MoxR family ATPase [Nanchangia anserum]